MQPVCWAIRRHDACLPSCPSLLYSLLFVVRITMARGMIGVTFVVAICMVAVGGFSASLARRCGHRLHRCRQPAVAEHNAQLGETNQQLADMKLRLTEVNLQLLAANRRLDSTQENVGVANAKIDKTNEGLAHTIAELSQTNTALTHTNEKLAVIDHIIEKFPLLRRPPASP